MKNKLIPILAGIGLFLIVTGVSYAFFSFGAGKSLTAKISSPVTKVSPSAKPKYKVDPSIPKTEACPLNGVMYTKQEADVWNKRRPLAIMVENSAEARPHSGISKADIIYEALAEGWITRFMAVFYCNTPFDNIAVAPVRSARTYFVDWVSEYDALYNHVGGANTIGANADATDPRADALGQIDRYGIKDMDQFGIGYPDCYRNPDRLDHPVATEHTMVCFTDNLYKIAEKRGWTNVDSRGIAWDKNFVEWKFKDDTGNTSSKEANSINIKFTEGYEQYYAQWQYDKATNTYKRSTGGVSHMDLDTNEQLAAKNIVVELTKMTGPVDSTGHLLYTTIGTGKALIFQDGKVTVGTWDKKTRVSRTMFYGADKKEINFDRGLIWIEIVDDESKVTYQ